MLKNWKGILRNSLSINEMPFPSMSFGREGITTYTGIKGDMVGGRPLVFHSGQATKTSMY